MQIGGWARKRATCAILYPVLRMPRSSGSGARARHVKERISAGDNALAKWAAATGPGHLQSSCPELNYTIVQYPRGHRCWQSRGHHRSISGHPRAISGPIGGIFVPPEALHGACWGSKWGVCVPGPGIPHQYVAMPTAKTTGLWQAQELQPIVQLLSAFTMSGSRGGSAVLALVRSVPGGHPPLMATKDRALLTPTVGERKHTPDPGF